MKKVVFIIVIFVLIPFGMYLYKISAQKSLTAPAQLSSQPTSVPTSGADLSNIIVIAEESVELKLFDSYGNTVGESFMQQPLKNSVSGKLSGPPTKELLFSDPESGQYRLTTKSSGKNTVEVYLYDRNAGGNIKKFETRGSGSYLINFDKENSNNSTISQL